MGLILYTAFVGALGGLAAWLALEPFAPHLFFDPAWQAWSRNFAMLVGGLIAGLLGGAYGQSLGSRRHILTGLGIGAIAGALMGMIGMSLGGNLAQALFPGFDQGFSVRSIPGRVLQIAPFGGAIGLAVGLAARSGRQAILGLVGGSIAGVASGVLFNAASMALQPISQALRGGDEIGMPGRVITSVLLGGAIGLCVALARRVARTAWLRLSLGRNEGREWVVEAPQTFIGRSESAHVPLFGDANVAPMHACIVRLGPHYWLQDGGTPIGTYLNGQRVQQAPLISGSQITVGGFTLEFVLKAGSAPARAAEQLRGQQPMAQPIVVPQVQTPRAASPTLVALDGPFAGRRFPLAGPLEVGREAAGIALPFDGTASRRHAKFEPVGTGWQVVDLGSTNGTLINGVQLASSPLRAGDVVQVGATSFRFEG